jgi:hypothetical protein
MMNINSLKKGDLVYYNDFIEESFARPQKQLGVIVHVYENVNPLFDYMTGNKDYAHEYVVLWIATGFRSTLLGVNLIKVEAPSDTLPKNQ